jgi:flavin-dependent dehydrogenase
MERCDVVVVGGGPAGSSCARALHDAGLEVIVLDRAVFPRDKVCAGWITPQAVDDVALDQADYQRGRTWQPITGFRTGVIGSSNVVDTAYDRPVSYGIRRCEFDHYLLRRSGADVRQGTPLSSVVRDGAGWILNHSIRADMLVGAGGHFCPVARWLNPTAEERQPLVVAQEAEFVVEPGEAATWPMVPGVPELYFCRDLSGYGWCFRKGQYVNIGFGLLGRRSLPKAIAEFVERFGAACDCSVISVTWPRRSVGRFPLSRGCRCSLRPHLTSPRPGAGSSPDSRSRCRVSSAPWPPCR